MGDELLEDGLKAPGNLFLALLKARDELCMTEEREYSQEDIERLGRLVKKENKKIIIHDEARSLK